MLLIVDVELLLPQIRDTVHQGNVAHANTQHRARHDIDDRIDVRVRNIKGQRDGLYPLPVGIRAPMKFTIFRFYHRDLVSQAVARSWRIFDINRPSRSSAAFQDVAIETHEREPLAILEGALALQSNDDVGGKCAKFGRSVVRQLTD